MNANICLKSPTLWHLSCCFLVSLFFAIVYSTLSSHPPSSSLSSFPHHISFVLSVPPLHKHTHPFFTLLSVNFLLLFHVLTSFSPSLPSPFLYHPSIPPLLKYTHTPPSLTSLSSPLSSLLPSSHHSSSCLPATSSRLLSVLRWAGSLASPFFSALPYIGDGVTVSDS